MITFKTLSKKWKCPTQWSEMTYGQYIYHIYPRTLAETISLLSGIDLKTLQEAELKGLEKINIALAFMSISPNFERTPFVNGYFLPSDPTIESLGQFEDLRSLLGKLPRKKISEMSYEELELFHDLCLEACAIYMQKVQDGKYDYSRVAKVKEWLKAASCEEVIGTGSFFLFRPLNISPPSRSLFRILIHRLKRLIQGLPGYQKTLDFMLRSSTSHKG